MKRFVCLGLVLTGCVVNAPPPNNGTATNAAPAPTENTAATTTPATNGGTTTTGATTTPATAGGTTTPATNGGTTTPATNGGTTTTTSGGTTGTNTTSTTLATDVKPAAYADTPEPTEAPKDQKSSVADGRPKAFKAGEPMAFWVWQDAKGTRWHVRTTSKSQMHRFHGSIVAEGDLKSAKATKAEWGDRVKTSGKRASFDFYTDGGSDGFDFDVAGNGCVKFYLSIDGKPMPEHINLGKDQAHPEKGYFKLCN